MPFVLPFSFFLRSRIRRSFWATTFLHRPLVLELSLTFHYRNISILILFKDTAAVYHNEEAVGRAIRDSGIPREELFVTSKLGPKDHGSLFSQIYYN